MFEIVSVGIFVGLLSGFFGIGGGTILVPSLLYLGFDIKTAIGVSIIQMMFSSIFGTYLNKKKGSLDISMVTYIGVGGFIGGLFGANITLFLDAKVLEIIFLGFVLFALARLFFKTSQTHEERQVSNIILISIGFILGAFAITIGVGGSIILVPLLVGFFNVELKKATSAGLFFVIFSSVSGFISHSINGELDITSGMIVGLASLIGVYFGIHLKHQVTNALQKNLLISFYLCIVFYLLQRSFFN